MVGDEVRDPTAASTRRRARKLSVSLPEEIAALVERRASEHGVPFSTELADLVRRELDAEEHERLEAALALDAEENTRFAGAIEPVTAEMLRSLEW
ncbi:MAG: hypothetical protein A2X23_02295 [Chloroflexi bacterium GWC2_73_18]|nr:MAG: hypothetical protein A2X23_02295 [Chloroflexi bacterium GWC2_73_18]